MSERRTEAGDEGEASARTKRDLEFRRATGRAILELSGAIGYERASVVAVVERSGANLSRFYGTYGGKAECYAEAYEGAIELLASRLLARCAEAPDWASGMRGALLELADFVAEDPALAAGVIREVHVVGGVALASREEVTSRLALAVDRARAERSRLSPPPPATAHFVVAGIEAAVIRCLTEGRALEEMLPSLLFFAVSSYKGAADARRAMKAFPPPR